MMRIRTAVFTLLTGIALVGAAAGAHAQAREQARLLTASSVLKELRATRDQNIPDRLLDRAYGIAVFPDLTKAAFFFGGARGHGVLVVRDKSGRFSNPAFVTMTGGSFGWQWGVQQTDIVLVFTTPKGIEGINGGKLTLGANASVAAGPVGRQASAATDPTFKAEVYSYSRSRGVFAGIALDGSVISMDDKANAAFYKKPGVAAGDILAGNVTSDDEAVKHFMGAVATSTDTGTQRTASATPPPVPSGPAGTAPAKPAASSAGAQTFPLADPQPGREPR
jgi:lipid-binding SYLF domain-containing protein